LVIIKITIRIAVMIRRMIHHGTLLQEKSMGNHFEVRAISLWLFIKPPIFTESNHITCLLFPGIITSRDGARCAHPGIWKETAG